MQFLHETKEAVKREGRGAEDGGPEREGGGGGGGGGGGAAAIRESASFFFAFFGDVFILTPMSNDVPLASKNVTEHQMKMGGKILQKENPLILLAIH